MGAEGMSLNGSGGAESFVCDVKELRRRVRLPVEEGAVTGAAIGPYSESKFMGIINENSGHCPMRGGEGPWRNTSARSVERRLPPLGTAAGRP